MAVNKTAVNLRSNMLRGDYMKEIVDRTIREIHDDLATVFGPYAVDAYIMQNGNTYYTRDGKENVRSMQFDSALSQYVLQILFQAICDQAEKVGDGTTTMGIFYTNLYQLLREADIQLDRESWEAAVANVNAEIVEQKEDMTEDDLIQMLFTCTQDAELSSKIYVKLKDAIMENAYVVINKSNIASDFNVTVSNNPMIKAYRQFSIRPVNATENACTILHCNGVLDISHVDVLLSLISRVAASGTGEDQVFYPKTIVLLCNGISEGTRIALKEVIQRMNTIKNTGGDIANYNNLAVYTLRDYRSYNAEQLEDLSTIITDEYGIGGLVNQLTFESIIYQAIKTSGQTIDDIPELDRFDADIEHITRMRDMIDDRYTVEFDEIEGIRIRKPLGPVAQQRYDELRQRIKDEKVGVVRVDLNKRLRTMYGQFIEVEVGSRLLKDSQRKYELILDAVLAAGQGVEFGVLRANSILVAIKAADKIYHRYESIDDSTLKLPLKIIRNAFVMTLADMVAPQYNVIGTGNTSTDATIDFLLGLVRNGRLEYFDLHRDGNLNVALPPTSVPEETLEKTRREHSVIIQGETPDDEDRVVTFKERIIEPVSVITTILKNSTMMLELATARSFHLDSFCNNYID